MESIDQFSFSQGKVKVDLSDGVSFEGIIRDGHLTIKNEFQDYLSGEVLAYAPGMAIQAIPAISFSCELSCITVHTFDKKVPKSLMRLIRV